MIRINASGRELCELPSMPQKSMLIKVLLAVAVKLAIVVAAVVADTFRQNARKKA